MTARLLYLDSSAVVKLVTRQPESRALFGLLEPWPDRISSALARVEVLRALLRARASAAELRRADDVLSRIALVKIDSEVLATAAVLEPRDLRTLDAIHLATAVSVGADLGGLVSYDRRLANAAKALGIEVWAPA